MPDRRQPTFKDRAPVLLTALNVILVAMIGVVGFMARDLYIQVRAYPNTEIRRDVDTLDSRIKKKADVEKVDLLTQELRSQYNRLCEQMDRQSDKLDEINVYLRDSSSKQ